MSVNPLCDDKKLLAFVTEVKSSPTIFFKPSFIPEPPQENALATDFTFEKSPLNTISVRPNTAALPSMKLTSVSLSLTVNSILVSGFVLVTANEYRNFVTLGMLATNSVIVELPLNSKDCKDSNASNGLPPPELIASTASPKPLAESHAIWSVPPVLLRMRLAV